MAKKKAKKLKATKTAVQKKEFQQPKAEEKTSMISMFSLAFAILGLFIFGIIFGLIAVVTGLFARAQTKQKTRSRMFANLGLILGVIDVVGIVLILTTIK